MPIIHCNYGFKNTGNLEELFYQKLKLFAKGSWNGSISIKECNRKFSLLFMSKRDTKKVLLCLSRCGLVKITKTDVIIVDDYAARK